MLRHYKFSIWPKEWDGRLARRSPEKAGETPIPLWRSSEANGGSAAADCNARDRYLLKVRYDGSIRRALRLCTCHGGASIVH
jgi:hypothetical protein